MRRHARRLAHTSLQLLLKLHLLGMRQVREGTGRSGVVVGEPRMRAKILDHALLWDMRLLNEAGRSRSVNDGHAHRIRFHAMGDATTKDGIHQSWHVAVGVVAYRCIALVLPEHFEVLDDFMTRQRFKCRVS